MDKHQKEQIKNLIEDRLGIEVLDIDKSNEYGCIIYSKDNKDNYFHLKLDDEKFNLYSLFSTSDDIRRKQILPNSIKNSFNTQLEQIKDIFEPSINQKRKNYELKLIFSSIQIASGNIKDIKNSKPMSWVYNINIPVRNYSDNGKYFKDVGSYEMEIFENEHVIQIKPLKLSEFYTNKDDELLTFRKVQQEMALKFIFLDIVKCLHYDSFYPFGKNIHSFLSNRETENLPFENFSKLDTLDEMISLYKKEMMIQEMFEI
jgi:hypothetical protein